MNRRELRKISRELRSYSSRLLNTTNEMGLDDARRLINFINRTPLIKEYIDSCISKYIVNIEQIISKMDIEINIIFH